METRKIRLPRNASYSVREAGAFRNLHDGKQRPLENTNNMDHDSNNHPRVVRSRSRSSRNRPPKRKGSPLKYIESKQQSSSSASRSNRSIKSRSRSRSQSPENGAINELKKRSAKSSSCRSRPAIKIENRINEVSDFNLNCIQDHKQDSKRVKHDKVDLDLDRSSSSVDETESKENKFTVKSEDNLHQSDDEDAVTYNQIRENNLKANREFLARIGMQKAKEDLESSIQKKKIVPSHRGLKQKKVEDSLPRRQSLRIRRIDPTGAPLPDPEPVEEPIVEQRLPEIITMEERQYSKNYNELKDIKPFLSTICSLDKEEIFGTLALDSTEHIKFVSDIHKINITEDQVAKVVPGRIYSLTWHPSKSHLMAMAGDVNGCVGMWNVLAGDDDDDIVKAFHPHIKPVTHLYVPPTDGHKLYTSSYDATLRCGDFEKGVFDLVFSVPEENDDLFRNFDFIGSSSSMLVSHFSGVVSLVDTRTASTSAEKVFKVSRYSLRKVSVHPLSTNYFITAGRDAKINLWDMRYMNAKAPVPIQTLRCHSKAVISAYFSPMSGNQILSSSSDDTIQIHTAKEGMKYELTSLIRHNNHTGRWLTPFQPAWHPTVEGIFVTGSMARPRQIEIFDGNGRVVQNLVGDYLGSVCSLNAFHPTRPTCVVGANSSGRLHVFK